MTRHFLRMFFGGKKATGSQITFSSSTPPTTITLRRPGGDSRAAASSMTSSHSTLPPLQQQQQKDGEVNRFSGSTPSSLSAAPATAAFLGLPSASSSSTIGDATVGASGLLGAGGGIGGGELAVVCVASFALGAFCVAGGVWLWRLFMRGKGSEDESEMTSASSPVTVDEVYAARKAWISAVEALDIDRVASLYTAGNSPLIQQREGWLLGTIDTFDTPIRQTTEAIRDYFVTFLDKKSIHAGFHTHIYPHDIIQLGQGSAVYCGYYNFSWETNEGEHQTAHAKFAFVYHRNQQTKKLDLVSHVSGLTPEGVETHKEDMTLTRPSTRGR